MIRVNYIQQITNLVVFLLLQIPLLYKWVLFDKAFGFFYIGFVLFLPYGLNRATSMLIALASGLLIDVFSNTPGIHASACVFLAFTKDFWFRASMGVSDDDVYLDWHTLKIVGSLSYLLPLIILHHLIIFTIENGGFEFSGGLISKILYSSLYSFVIIFLIGFLTAPNKRRT